MSPSSEAIISNKWVEGGGTRERKMGVGRAHQATYNVNLYSLCSECWSQPPSLGVSSHTPCAPALKPSSVKSIHPVKISMCHIREYHQSQTQPIFSLLYTRGSLHKNSHKCTCVGFKEETFQMNHSYTTRQLWSPNGMPRGIPCTCITATLEG